MSFASFFSKQARKPSGFFGKLVMARIFDKGNIAVNDLMKTALDMQADDHVLEIGFGTGKLIAELAGRIDGGLVRGIDFSKEMASLAARRNKVHIARGKVILQQGNFEETAFGAESFDKVCSANTIYFWPDPDLWVRKIHKILKPGGKLVIAFEDQAQLRQKPLDKGVFRIYSRAEIEFMLSRNGFAQGVAFTSRKIDTQIFHCAAALKQGSTPVYLEKKAPHLF
jgi:ubiquinone/menaquinone biosynthesis C-methylase UbiE